MIGKGTIVISTVIINKYTNKKIILEIDSKLNNILCNLDKQRVYLTPYPHGGTQLYF